jgi:epoxide hydrolase-like predicted phosphatase
MLGLSASEMQDFQTDFWGGDSLDSQLVEYIRALHKRWKTGLLSNAFTSLRRVVTEHWQFADAFDEMIISAEVGLLKPDARIYQLALQRLGVDAKESIFIDDYTENVEGAQAVMMRAIHFTSPAQVVAELETLLNGGAAWLKAS